MRNHTNKSQIQSLCHITVAVPAISFSTFSDILIGEILKASNGLKQKFCKDPYFGLFRGHMYVFNIFLTLVLPLQYFPGKHAHLLHMNLCSTRLSARTKPFSNFHIHEDRAYFPALSTHEICDKEGKRADCCFISRRWSTFLTCCLVLGIGGKP